MECAFRRDKFKELMLYIAKRSEADPKFGAIKLNKLLYFADFRAYAENGQPITGARYQKLRWGPAARALLPVRAELIEEGAAELESVQYGHPQDRLVALREPDIEDFSPRELKIIDEVIEEHGPVNGSEISNVSHEAPGWQLARLQEDIPYHTVRITRPEPPPEILEEAVALADSHGWLP